LSLPASVVSVSGVISEGYRLPPGTPDIKGGRGMERGEGESGNEGKGKRRGEGKGKLTLKYNNLTTPLSA